MQQRDLLRFLKNALLLLLIVVALDRLIGYGLERLFFRQHHGDDATTTYVMEQARADLLVFGSSRASHHYKTDMLARESGMTAFNAGRDEMTVPYAAALLPVLYGRYTPKVVLLEVLPNEFSAKGKELVYQRIATVLMPFARRHPGLVPTIGLAGKAEVWKMRLSYIYAYNSLIGSAFQNAYTSLGHESQAGYEPLWQTIDPATYKKPIWGDFTREPGVDTAYLAHLQSVISLTRSAGTKLVVVLSPFYFPHPVERSESYRALKGLLQQSGVPLYDYSLDSTFLMKPHLFNDDVHLNDSGATVFTRIIAGRLKAEGIVPGGPGAP